MKFTEGQKDIAVAIGASVVAIAAVVAPLIVTIVLVKSCIVTNTCYSVCKQLSSDEAKQTCMLKCKE